MAKTSSKTDKRVAAAKVARPKGGNKTRTKTRKQGRAKGIRGVGVRSAAWWRGLVARVQQERAKHIHLHRSFHRSYREDYLRETVTPGLLSHAMLTFKTIFSHWRTFVPLILLSVMGYILLVGLMSEDTYQQFRDAVDASEEVVAGGNVGNFAKAGLLFISTLTTGGLDTGMGETQTIFMIMLFLVIWLVTIFLLRHFLSGGQPKLRDGLYNALMPLLSTFVVFVVIFIQAIPLMLTVIAYSAAVTTDFLSTPFYALVFFIFAAVMLLLSGYLLSSSVVALVAVTAPGLYPMKALFAAADLMAGRRTRMVLRLLYLILVIILVYILVMLPVILLDMGLKSLWSWLTLPIVPFFLLLTTCFLFIYLTTYLYLYYRWLLDYQEK